jgi:1-acyl-sn-glycerol-3-phosphate acyltransferase
LRRRPAETNKARRALYFEAEQLLGSGSDEDAEIVAYQRSLRLDTQAPAASTLARVAWALDSLLRFAGVWMCLMTFSVVTALPSIAVKPIDLLLVRLGLLSPFYQLTVLTKRFISLLVIWISGIELDVVGDRSCYLRSGTVTMYSHTSTVDAFIMSCVLPVRQLTVAKAELFLIPFFSWLLTAYGGFAVDRANRDKAVRVLRWVAASMGRGGACDSILIAPEGTRSGTGHLLEFKKGPFYVWDDLRVDVVPLVVFGAFELLPPGQQMNLPGRVVVQVLPPIAAGSAASREEMSRLVRSAMTAALAVEPDLVSAPLPVHVLPRAYLLIALLGWADWRLGKLAYSVCQRLLGSENLSLTHFMLAMTGLAAAVTLLVYVYAVVLVPLLCPRPKAFKKD